MSKNKFGIPGILFSPTPSPTPVPGGNVIGGGTAQNGLGNNDLPMSFNEWVNANLWSFYDEQNDKGTPGQPDMYDYGMWWADCDYSREQWELSGNDPNDYNTYVGPYLW